MLCHFLPSFHLLSYSITLFFVCFFFFPCPVSLYLLCSLLAELFGVEVDGSHHMLMLMQECPHQPSHPGCLRAAENAEHHKGWGPKIYFAAIMTVDPSPVMYSGHLDASGRKQRIKENTEGKASRKTFELLHMCQETNLG